MNVAPVRPDQNVRTPRGYVPTAALAGLGIYLAILAPVFGGLSVKIQDMVGLADAPAQLGLITGVGALFSMVSQPLAGRLSDRTVSRFGMRRPWFILGLVGTTIALLGCAVAPSIPLLLVAWCAAQALANFAFAAHTATIADQVPETRRGSVAGILGAASPASILVAAVLLAAVPNDFLRFAVPALIGLVLGLVFLLVLKDRVRASRSTEPFGIKMLITSFVFNPRKNPDLGYAWLSKFLINIGYGSVATYLTLFLGTAYGMSPTEQLGFNAISQVVSIGTLIVASVLGGYISDRIGVRKPFLVVSGAVLAFAIVAVALSPAFGTAGLTVLILAQGVLGLGAGCFFAVDQALCISLLPSREDTAKDLGVLNLANTLPSAIAPLLAGIVFIPIGNALFGGGYTLWFFFAAILALTGGLLVLRIRGVR